MLIVSSIVLSVLGLIFLYDVIQKKHAILRNFPIIGHFRYLFETIGPELRQYIVTNNNEERPFSRDQRRWVYATSKEENNYFGFGTDEDLDINSNYIIIKHSAFPLSMPHVGDATYDSHFSVPCKKVLGEHRNRKHKFRPQSIVNISSMSYGSLSANAIEAINKGCKLAGCLQSTGEGGISDHHKHGGELIWQIGTGYFGCRNENGGFDLEIFLKTVSENPVKAIELKLSQGAKPGLGGILPAQKVTEEIAAIRGIPVGKDCVSPASHSAFHDVDSLLDFVEMIAEKTGLPVGIKSAVGDLQFWEDLAAHMEDGSRGVDFITIDGGEGGTGAGPLVFTDHVSFPFKIGFNRVYKIFSNYNLAEKVVFIGSGKLGFPESATFALALGCDLINVARTAMLSIGCIQAQACHTGNCPTGIATQSQWLMRGLDPTLKSNRLANYVMKLRKELLQIAYACGHHHPGDINSDQLEIIDDHYSHETVKSLFK